jgi:hypothetical protein
VPDSTRHAYDDLVVRARMPDILICAGRAAAFHPQEELDFAAWQQAREAKFLTVINMVDIAKRVRVAPNSPVGMVPKIDWPHI